MGIWCFNKLPGRVRPYCLLRIDSFFGFRCRSIVAALIFSSFCSVDASILNRFRIHGSHNGKIAFWTKSDSLTYFAETRIVYRPRETLAQALVVDALKKYPRLLDLQIYAASRTNASDLRIVGSKEPASLGQPAPKETRDVLEGKGFYYGKDGRSVMVILPLHDWNGDRVAAVKVLMKTFPGQTEKNALSRATPILTAMAPRVQSARALVE